MVDSRRILAASLGIWMASIVAAIGQSDASLSVGLGVTHFVPTQDDLSDSTSLRPFLRLRGDPGWNPVLTFPWYKAELRGPGEPNQRTLRARPVMAGVSYTLQYTRLAISGALITGYSFNKIFFDAKEIPPDASLAERTTFQIKDSLVFGPRFSLWYDLSPKWGAHASVTYLISRPLLITDTEESHQEARLKTDMFALKLGIAFGVF